jgi:hypothetical protein
MNHYLVEHALRNVWCAPQQDRQHVLRLTRLTPRTGAYVSIDYQFERIYMPSRDARYHVYQIGQNRSPGLGLPTITEIWTKMSDACEIENLVMDLYLTNGLQIPRSESWMHRNDDGNLILAVRICPTIDNLDDQDLYLRMYSNAWFDSDVVRPANNKIVVRGGLIKTMSELLNLQHTFEIYKGSPTGHAYAFHNGRFVDHFDSGSVVIGDVVEFVFDPTVDRIHEIKIGDLDIFDSNLDAKGKYLIHLPKALADRIDFYDDLDVFLIKRNTRGHARGLYYHKNQPDAVRMVTHNDYSVPVMYVQAYQPHGESWVNMEDVYLRFHIRDASVYRPLVFENNRIHELYKLNDIQIVRAMIGTNATVEEWQAPNLEQSNYTTLMRLPYENVTLDAVATAYGYNGMTVVAANTPQRVTVSGERRYVVLPPELRQNATVFEYDGDGLLLGVMYHENNVTYIPQYPSCVMIEAISGRAGLELDGIIGFDPVTVDPNYSYRVYRTQNGYLPGVRTWEDVTGTTDYVLENNLITFTDNTEAWTYLVISDKKFLTYSFDLTYRDHLLKFSLRWKPVGQEAQIMEVPPGRIAVWMNGRSLIEGLDYVVNFPEVVICNKQYLSDITPWTQKIVVRCTGFCDAELNREPIGEFGFVKHRMLSRNNQFDIRDDKVIRCVADGRMLHRDQLRFSEDDSGVTVESVYEGAPYQVNELFVPVRGVTNFNTLVLRQEARVIDTKVKAYLSTYLPEPVIGEITFIRDKYALYSPFLAKILYDIVTGVKTIDGSFRSDHQIMSECNVYQPLLTYDPCLNTGLDLRYVAIHPHDSVLTLEVTMQEYAYLSRVIGLFLQNKVDLTRFVTVK